MRKPAQVNSKPQSIDRAQRNVALLVAGCFFMEMLDGTIVTTSAPKIAAALHTSIGSIALVITAYLVTLAVLIPLSGWTAARLGPRTTFLGAIAVFTIASVGCAASTSIAELVTMRVLQGAGGAMMVPVGRLVVLSRSDNSNLMRLTALLVWPGLLAPVFAPLAGGLITTYASWHWLFLINLPLGALAFIIAARIVHPGPLANPGPLDVTGLVLTSIGLGGLTFAANLLAESHTDWVLVAGIAGPAIVLLGLAAVHLFRVNAPLIDLRLLSIDTFRSALTGTGLYFMVINAGPFLAPLLFEEVFNWSAIKAGAVVLFIFVGNIGSKFTTTYLYSRFGFRAVLIASTAVMALSLVLLGLVSIGAPVAVVALILLVNGSSRSIGATGYTTVVFTDVPQTQMRHANTLQLTVQQLGAGSGVAAGAIALRLGRPVGGIFTSDVSTHAIYTVALALMACVSLLATFEAARMRPGSGDALRGSRAPTTPPATAADHPQPEPAN
jgi:EmrB/QacA subfamily drug resistance transporter